MSKRTANSYPLDGLKGCIGILESTYHDGKYDYDMYKAYHTMSIEPMLEELGETARKNKFEECLEDLKKLLDKLENKSTIELEFYNTEENDSNE